MMALMQTTMFEDSVILAIVISFLMTITIFCIIWLYRIHRKYLKRELLMFELHERNEMMELAIKITREEIRILIENPDSTGAIYIRERRKLTYKLGAKD